MGEDGIETGSLAGENEALRRRVAALEGEVGRFQAALHSIGDAFIATDAAGSILQMNRVSEALTGWTEVEARGRPVSEVFRVVDEQTGAEAEDLGACVLRQGAAVENADRTMLARDGTRRPIIASGAPMADENGRVTAVVLVFRDHTKELRALQALQESEVFNRAIVESIPQRFFLKDRGSVYLAVNESYATSLGCKPEQLVGKDDFAFYPAELAEKHRADDRAAMAAGRVTDLEESCLAQGKGRWVHTTRAPVRNNTGEVTAVLGLLEDITERRQAAHALEASEARYRRLFEAAKDGILILDPSNGRIVDVNPFLLELTGYSRDELLGKRLWEIGPFKDIAASKASFAELHAEKYVRYEDLPLATLDGRKVDVEFVSNIYRVDGQNVIQCNIRDITARKLAEDELRFRNLILSTQQEASIDGILVVGVDGAIVSSNQRFVEMWGIPPDIMASGSDEAAMQSVADKLASPEEFLVRVKHLYANPRDRSQDEIELKDGRTISRHSAPMLGTDGRHFGRLWQFRDVTADKRAEKERRQLEEQLRASQKMDAVGGLAGGIAHDFNNLLSVILSYTSLVLDVVHERDPMRDDLLAVKEAAERAAVLTRQLLAFGRKQVLQPVPLDLNRVAGSLEKMLRRIVGEDVDFVQVLSPDLGLTLADPGQIEQVLMNLVVNARDAMPDGGRLTIETSNAELDETFAAHHLAVKPGPFVQLTVTDTGCGMDAETRARVFEPFFTTKEKGRGTGLGLSTVYGIVKQSGGDIWIYSEPGQGTTFKIYLPRDLSATEAATVRPSAVPRRSSGAETILVVEDEEALRKVAKRSLDAAGYTVLTAANGDEALLTSSQHPGDIHVLLTDLVMPRMSGAALARELTKARPTLKVIYMSGYADDAIVHHGVLDPGIRFLSKPFTVADLTQKVRNALDGDLMKDPSERAEDQGPRTE